MEFLLDDKKVKLTKTLKRKIEKESHQHWVVFLAINEKLKRLIWNDEPVHEEAKYAIEEIKSLDFENVIMTSRDSKSVVKIIGITESQSQVYSEDKS